MLATHRDRARAYVATTPQRIREERERAQIVRTAVCGQCAGKPVACVGHRTGSDVDTYRCARCCNHDAHDVLRGAQ